MTDTYFRTLSLADLEELNRSIDSNFLICADCLKVLEMLPDECIDLIYIDPPFATQSNRRTKRNKRGYADCWSGGLGQFMEFLTQRLSHMHRVLKYTGTIYVHIDYRTVHYVRIELDRIFGADNFLNEIIWSYKTGGVSKRWFGRKHQNILSYAKKIGEHKFNVIREGKFRTDGLNVDLQGRFYKSTKKGRLYFNSDGPALTDVWEIPFLSTVGLERTGYPDQKPLALLDRIIRASSCEGDIVADFFAGSGTTGIAAQNLNRRWILTDNNSQAVELIEQRFRGKGNVHHTAKTCEDCLFDNFSSSRCSTEG